MAARGVLCTIEGGKLGFWCPGCECMHAVSDRWTFNENHDAPTFSPSILVHWVKITEKGEQQYRDWCAAGFPKLGGSLDHIDMVCHSFVRDGQIIFLPDCTHALAGKTVPLEVFDAGRNDHEG